MKKYVILALLFTINKGISQTYNAEILKYSTTCKVDRNKINQTDSITIQINNRSGEIYTDIAIQDSKIEKVSDLQAWIEDSRGTRVRELKRNEVSERSAISGISLYEDDYIKTFRLKHNTYPYRIAYTYKTSVNEFITLTRWTPVLYREIPTREASLKVEIPWEMNYKYIQKNIGNPVLDSTNQKVDVLKWKTTYDKIIKSEIFSNPESLIPMVVICSEGFRYGTEGSLKDWSTYGDWQYRLIKGLDVLPENEKKVVSGLISGLTDKRQIIKTLYHYLQDQTRYVNVRIGVGGLKPYPAYYVAQNKYGDCKALSNYMKALLSYAGIESIYANVNLSDQPGELMDYAGPQFNHAVLAVPLDKDTIWLENTSKTAPFAYIGSYIQGQNALLINGTNSSLVRIPESKKKDVNNFNRLEFDLNLNGTAKLTLTNVFRGRDFEAFSQFQSDYNENEKERIIREYMPFENYEVISWKLNRLNRDSAKIELRAELNLYKYLKPLAREYYCTVHPLRLPVFEAAEKRTLPVSIPSLAFVSDTLVYHLPEGYELKNTPEPVELTSPFGKFRSEYISSGKKVIISRIFELYSGKYSLDQYPDFYEFIKTVKTKNDQKIILKPLI